MGKVSGESIRAKVVGSKAEGLRGYLENDVWPTIPRAELGGAAGREEEDRILGYGADGV